MLTNPIETRKISNTLSVISIKDHDDKKTITFDGGNMTDLSLYHDHWYSVWKTVQNTAVSKNTKDESASSNTYTLVESVYSKKQINSVKTQKKIHSAKQWLLSITMFLVVSAIVTVFIVFPSVASWLDSIPLWFDGEALLMLLALLSLLLSHDSKVNILDYMKKTYGEHKPPVVKADHDRCFHLEGLSFTECDDIVEELQQCRVRGDSEGYMKIYHAISTDDYNNLVIVNKELEKQRLEQKIEVASRKNKNRYLNGTVSHDTLKSLQQSLEELSSKHFVSDPLVKKVNELLNQFDNVDVSLTVYDKIAYDNCRNELEAAVTQFNNSIKSGIELTANERAEFEDLLKTSSIILNRVKDNVLQQINDEFKKSNTFLKTKYVVE